MLQQQAGTIADAAQRHALQATYVSGPNCQHPHLHASIIILLSWIPVSQQSAAHRLSHVYAGGSCSRHNSCGCTAVTECCCSGMLQQYRIGLHADRNAGVTGTPSPWLNALCKTWEHKDNAAGINHAGAHCNCHGHMVVVASESSVSCNHRGYIDRMRLNWVSGVRGVRKARIRDNAGSATAWWSQPKQVPRGSTCWCRLYFEHTVLLAAPWLPPVACSALACNQVIIARGTLGLVFGWHCWLSFVAGNWH